jgi:2-polyprenyl-3-methyl-5-hydroxy-6-metoxy-1,4-benzoquinol methylase
MEAGCGAGFSAAYLEGKYSRFHGIDYASKLIELANHLNNRAGVTFATANIKDVGTTEPGRFDAIFMIGVLHHLNIFMQASRVCSDWSLLVVTLSPMNRSRRIR